MDLADTPWGVLVRSRQSAPSQAPAGQVIEVACVFVVVNKDWQMHAIYCDIPPLHLDPGAKVAGMDRPVICFSRASNQRSSDSITYGVGADRLLHIGGLDINGRG